MLTFQLDEGKEVHIERESIEEKILEGIFTKFEEAREKEPGMYNGFKQAVHMLKLVGGIKIDVPKGENTLEYLVAHFLNIGMDLLEAAPIPVQGKVVAPQGLNAERTKTNVFRKNQCIEVLEVLEDGSRKVQNEGKPEDTWIIPKEVFESTYEEVKENG